MGWRAWDLSAVRKRGDITFCRAGQGRAGQGFWAGLRDGSLGRKGGLVAGVGY